MLRLVVILGLVISTLTLANASPSDVKKINSSLSRIKREEKTISSTVKRLSTSEKERLKTRTKGLDSDGDGVADVLEPAFKSGRCDADSDDDGLDDDQDPNENDSDGDDDGVSDANEVETKGRILSFADPVLIIGSTTLRITDTTVFFRGLSSKSDLVAGTCVESEGRRSGSDIFVDKIKKHTGAECGGADDDDKKDD